MFSQKTIPATLQLRHFLRQGFMPNRHKHLFYKFIKILSESMYTISIYHLQQGVPQLSHALHRSHLPLLSVSKVVVTLNEGNKCIVTTYLHALDQWRCYTLLIQPHLCHSLHRTSSTALASLSPLPVTFLVLPHPFWDRGPGLHMLQGIMPWYNKFVFSVTFHMIHPWYNSNRRYHVNKYSRGSIF